ncbi:MAG: hypothetical protein CO108_02250 [Deltaproteobacteria bacterium CG_4_9_14_3_um_filter_63_12]|nr:MAG: hypothetical protein COW42_01450 [Deltaproteobacteria bacterium CG17_big_fil_post_rev_8_21_14_2_50_63_7]PJB48524.1 MAG: hypothetical protein CO108_02250 [Deltaproteobacteria bacterium CG_4_9_14_3_um_filter_63_12]
MRLGFFFDAEPQSRREFSGTRGLQAPLSRFGPVSGEGVGGIGAGIEVIVRGKKPQAEMVTPI